MFRFCSLSPTLDMVGIICTHMAAHIHSNQNTHRILLGMAYTTVHCTHDSNESNKLKQAVSNGNELFYCSLVAQRQIGGSASYNAHFEGALHQVGTLTPLLIVFYLYKIKRSYRKKFFNWIYIYQTYKAINGILYRGEFTRRIFI